MFSRSFWKALSCIKVVFRRANNHLIFFLWCGCRFDLLLYKDVKIENMKSIYYISSIIPELAKGKSVFCWLVDFMFCKLTSKRRIRLAIAKDRFYVYTVHSVSVMRAAWLMWSSPQSILKYTTLPFCFLYPLTIFSVIWMNVYMLGSYCL